MKLVLYSFVGSALVFIGILAVFFSAGGQSFDILELVKHPLAPEVQIWVFPLIFVGFCGPCGHVAVPHVGADGPRAAPTAASMLLAGVVMKLARMLFPRCHAFISTGSRTLEVVIAVLAVIALCTAREWRWCRRISSSSLVTRASATWASYCSGWRHSTSWACRRHPTDVLPRHCGDLLFAVVGRMVYDRTHTRTVGRTGRAGQGDSFCVRYICNWRCGSMGMPGFSGFVAEYQILVGAFQMHPLLALAAD